MPEHNTLLLDADGAELAKTHVSPMPNGHPPRVVVDTVSGRAFVYKTQHPETWAVAVYYEAPTQLVSEVVPDGQ